MSGYLARTAMEKDSLARSELDWLLHALRQIDACMDRLRASAEALHDRSLGAILQRRALQWNAVGARLRSMTGISSGLREDEACPWAILARTRINLHICADDLGGVLLECRWNEALAGEYCRLLLSRDPSGELARELRVLLPARVWSDSRHRGES